MSSQDRGPDEPRIEVVSSTVVVRDDGSLARRNWGLLLAIGIVAVIFGIVVLANIWASVHLVAILAGLFLIFVGVAQLAGLGHAEGRGGRIAVGIIAIALGIALIAWPSASVKTIAVLVGISFLVWGVAVIVAAIVARGEGWGVAAGFGALLGLVGIIVIAWPGPTIAILMVLVGLFALLFGVSSIVQALALRKAR